MEEQFPRLRTLRNSYDWDAGMLIPFGSAWGSGEKEFVAGALMGACFRNGQYSVLQADILLFHFATSMIQVSAEARYLFWDMVEEGDIRLICGENGERDALVSPSPALVEKYLAASALRFVLHRKGWQTELQQPLPDEPTHEA